MNELILFRRQEDTIVPLPLVEELKTKALILASRVNKVTNVAENQAAVEAQLALQGFLKTVEDSRVFVKAPVLELGGKIDALAKQIGNDVKQEQMRLSRIVGDFQAAEQARARAAEALRLKDLEEIERRRQTELAQAPCIEAANDIQEKYNHIAAALPVTQAVKAEGQRVTQDFDIQVVDPILLANAHRNCVDIRPRLSEIKILLRAGVKVAGVIATPIVKAGVRVPTQKLIDV